MKKKVSANGDFKVREDEDIDLEFGTITYEQMKYSPIDGTPLEEVDVPSEEE